ncbi:MAG: hypothetical protein H6733_03885 [Alphaproteobacteria bacterium]|nr:hypothetical protein [Alphaproteobacteria bacterium]
MLGLLLALAAHAQDETPADWDVLRDPEGWEEVAARDIDIGQVVVSRREIGGMWCLRADADTKASADTLMDVLWDIPHAPDWSSNTLLVSEVLEPGDDHMVFWQHLDVPGWTLVHDRYWVLAVDAIREPDALGFAWERVDAEQDWPDVVAKAEGFDKGAMQPPIMWGEWRFERTPGLTHVVWRGCQDIGGRVPLWLQVWASGRSLPAAVADLVHAAEQR